MPVLTLAYAVSALVGAGIIFIGGRFLIAPQLAADGYGAGPDSGAYLSVKCVRDIFSGVLVFILIVAGAPYVLAWVMAAATLIPISGALIVLHHNGSRMTALGIHGVTALVMLIIAALLLLSSS